MTIAIAGERSGVGKTTIALSLLAYLCQRFDRVQSFKVGPDYIDPMFHAAVTQRPCRNLDPILTSESYIKSCYLKHVRDAEYAAIEGVMGLFDGIRWDGDKTSIDSSLPWFGSTAHVALLLNLPVLLVVDCSRLSGSVAAIVCGYRSLEPRLKLAGVVLNKVASGRHLELLEDALESLAIPILGVFYRQDEINLPDRHLGLIPSEEITGLKEIFDRLSHLAAKSFAWNKLLPLLRVDLSTSPTSSTSSTSSTSHPLRIAVARDRAFNFYYADNFDILQNLGAELIFWSPLRDRCLPENIAGLYFGGGFPEVFAEELSENETLLQEIRRSIHSGLPTYAECGGLMYLCKNIVDFSSKSWQMVGVLPTAAIMGQKLTLGYRRAIALENNYSNNYLVDRDTIIRGHEFHRSYLQNSPDRPLWQLDAYSRQSQPYPEGWQIELVHASYLHLHFGGNPSIAKKFWEACLFFRDKLVFTQSI
jgi:cobyrinic acid a,c-diamide synthase